MKYLVVIIVCFVAIVASAPVHEDVVVPVNENRPVRAAQFIGGGGLNNIGGGYGRGFVRPIIPVGYGMGVYPQQIGGGFVGRGGLQQVGALGGYGGHIY